MQELLLEVWHHCPRSQLVAAALSQGGTTSQEDLKYRDVFLGSGSAPLHSLLTRPQVADLLDPNMTCCALIPILHNIICHYHIIAIQSGIAIS